jgi:hypothetical protein
MRTVLCMSIDPSELSQAPTPQSSIRTTRTIPAKAPYRPATIRQSTGTQAQSSMTSTAMCQHRSLSRLVQPNAGNDPFGAGPIAIARGLRLSGSGKRGDCPGVFVSENRPKFTAKARSSPSLRTRKEAPGAGQSDLNRENAGTVPDGFCLVTV